MFRLLYCLKTVCCVSCNLISSFITITIHQSVSAVVKQSVEKISFLRLYQIEIFEGNGRINLCMNMKAVSMVCPLSGLSFLSKASEGRRINTEPAQP